MKKTYVVAVAAVLVLTGLVFMLGPDAALSSFGGFYLGFSAWLIFSAFRGNLLDSGIRSIVMIMTGILVGRTAGIARGMIPDAKLLVSAGVELAFALWGTLLIIRTKGKKDNGATH